MTLLMLLQATAGTAFALTVAGFLAPFVTHVTKKFLGVDSLLAYFVHLVVSGALAIGALAAFGEITWGDFMTTAPVVAVTSQTLFQFFKKFSGLTVEPGSEEPKPPAE